MASYDNDHLSCLHRCDKQQTNDTALQKSIFIWGGIHIIIDHCLDECMTFSQRRDISSDYINIVVNCFKMDTDNMLVFYTYNKYLYVLQ